MVDPDATTPTTAPARTLIPSEIVVHQKSGQLELAYENGARYRLSFELLRVYSPSAEVRGHGAGQEVLQTGKREIGIVRIEPVGHYAIKPVFSDGHESGIYSWDYLLWLCKNQEPLWQDYLQRLQRSGASRDASPAVQAQDVRRR